MMLRALPFIFFVVSLTNVLAQCNRPFPSDNACTSPYFCNTAQLNVHCSTIRVPITGKTYLVPKGFCGSLESPSWYRFKADSKTLSLRFTATGGCGSDGVQAVIFSTTNCADSASFTPLSNCINANGGQPTADITANNLVQGETYYLLVDGYSGAGCSFKINVLSGTIQDVVDPLSAPSAVYGATTVCANVTNAVFSVPFNTNASEYIYTLTANSGTPQTVSRPDSFYNVTNFPATGTLQVCVNYKNDCTQSPQKCTVVSIGTSNVVTLPSIYLCPNSAVTLGDGTIMSNSPAPATDVTTPYSYTATGSSGCDTTFSLQVTKYATRRVSKFFFIKSGKTETLGATLLSPNVDCSAKTGASTLKNTALNGCDSVVNYTVYNAQQSFTLQADKLTLGCKDSITLSLQNNNDACANISHNLKFKWLYKASANALFTDLNNSGTTQIAKTSGTYIVVITDSVFLKLQPLLGNRTFSDTLSFDVTQSNNSVTLTKPDAINQKDQIYLCQGITTAFNVAAVTGAKTYTWRTPNGVIKSGQGTTNVSVFWPLNSATDTLEVMAVSDCNTSPPRTIVVYFINFANLDAGKDSVFCDSSAVMRATASTLSAGGLGSWSNASTNTQNVTFTNFMLPTTPAKFPGVGVYDLIWKEDYAGCTKSDTVRYSVIKKPIISNVTDSCSADKKNGFAIFTITDGTPPFILTNLSTNTNTTINSIGKVTTPSFPKGNYNFSLKDANNCATFSLTGTSTCTSCATVAGNLAANKIQICYNDTARGNYLGGSKKNTGDTSEFVLHAGDPKFGILARSATAKFAFKAGLTYGKTYYISEIVGKDSTGHVTVLDPCFATGTPQPIVFNDKPRVSFTSKDTLLCKGSCAIIKFSNTGFAPFTIKTRITDTITHDSSFVNLKLSDSTQFCPKNSTALKMLSVIDSLGCRDTTLTAQLNFAVYLPPFAGTALQPLKLCSTLDTTLKLIDRLNNPDAGGTWTEVSAVKSTGTAFNAAAGTFKIAKQKNAVYKFSYIKNAFPLSSPCRADTSFIAVEIVAAPVADAGVDDTITCSKRVIQLGGTNTSQGAGVTYSWSGNGLAGNALKQFVTQAGNYYLAVQSGGCTAFDTVTAFIDTVSPNAKIKPFVGAISCTNPKLTLDASLSSPKNVINYLWLLGGNAVGQAVTYDAIMGGSYTLKVTLQRNGCSTIDTVFVQENKDNPKVSILAPSPITCNDTIVAIDGSNSSKGANYTFIWSARTGGKFAADTTTLFPKVKSGGDYKLVITNTTNSCKDSATVTVLVDTLLPKAQAYATDSLNCRNKTVSLSAKGTTFGRDINYLWIAQPGNIVSGETTLNAVVDQPGKYIFIVKNTSTGCKTVDTVKVNRIKAFPQSQRILISKASCYGECDATIRVDTVIGGIQPYRFSLDGFNYFSSQNFNNLCAGKYHVYTQDASGCQLDTNILVPQDRQLYATIGTDTLINLGDSISLQLYTNSDSLLKTDWSFYADSLCKKSGVCMVQTVKPTTVTTYKVTVTDKNLCTTDAQVRVAINKNRPVFIPNAFSPNGDGNNDLLYVYSAPVVRKVRSFKIYNRWGEQVFNQLDFQTNNPTNGWDGFFNGKEAPTGIYTYTAEIEFLDNSVELYNGELTLLR